LKHRFNTKDTFSSVSVCLDHKAKQQLNMLKELFLGNIRSFRLWLLSEALTFLTLSPCT